MKCVCGGEVKVVWVIGPPTLVYESIVHGPLYVEKDFQCYARCDACGKEVGKNTYYAGEEWYHEPKTRREVEQEALEQWRRAETGIAYKKSCVDCMYWSLEVCRLGRHAKKRIRLGTNAHGLIAYRGVSKQTSQYCDNGGYPEGYVQDCDLHRAGERNCDEHGCYRMPFSKDRIPLPPFEDIKNEAE